MSDSALLLLLVLLAGLAFGLGVWIGLGYPGLHDRYEDTGARAQRVAPFRQLLNALGRGRRRDEGRGVRGHKRGPGTGRWSHR